MGDGSDVDVDDAPVVLEFSEGDDGVQRDEAKMMARRWHPGWSYPPWIARRRSSNGRSTVVVDARLDLRQNKMLHGVKRVRKVETRREEVQGGCEVIGARRKWRRSAADRRTPAS